MIGYRRLELPELEEEADAFDRAVDRTPDTDHFCSTTPWILSAKEAFSPRGEPIILELDSGWAALMVVQTERLGRAAFPLEAAWGMAGPMAGARPAAVARDLVDALRHLRPEWDTLYFLGLVHGAEAFQELVRAYAGRRRLGQGMTATRCVSSLAGGLDGFLSRRSRKFRENLRRTRRRARELELDFQLVRPAPEEVMEVFRRVLEVERRSWKSREGHGIDSGRMRAFYRAMFPRLARRSDLWVGFLRQGEQDLAYVSGGVRGPLYRGLQISFDDAFRPYSLGNLAQFEMIRHLCEQGKQTYDLGQDMPYKHAWGEEIVETTALVVL